MPEDMVIVFCAHPDDDVLGMGGTLARYSKESKKVITVLFTNGEKSHLWLKEKITIEMRQKESQKAASVLGYDSYDKFIFLGLEEGRIEKEAGVKGVLKKLAKLIEDNKPSKIFTHSDDDPHPDHRTVNRVVLKLVDSLESRTEVYTFDVWNIIRFSRNRYPKMCVDITPYFRLKIRALECFRSQHISLLTLIWSVYLKAILNGWRHDWRFGEEFQRVR